MGAGGEGEVTGGDVAAAHDEVGAFGGDCADEGEAKGGGEECLDALLVIDVYEADEGIEVPGVATGFAGGATRARPRGGDINARGVVDAVLDAGGNGEAAGMAGAVEAVAAGPSFQKIFRGLNGLERAGAGGFATC